MKEIISKELLENVLWDDDFRIDGFLVQKDNDVWISLISDIGETKTKLINIYELAHKCKEWAFNQYLFIVMSEKHSKHWYSSATNENAKVQKTFISNLEPEAIFKACQWILENKEKH